MEQLCHAPYMQLIFILYQRSENTWKIVQILNKSLGSFFVFVFIILELTMAKKSQFRNLNINES